MAINGPSIDCRCGKRISLAKSSKSFSLWKKGVLSKSSVKSSKGGLFFEDVVSWLDISDVRYTPKVKFSGKSGYDHMFDFVVPKFREVPERFIEALTNPSKDAVGGLIYRWVDTKETREEGSKLYALLNDSDRRVHGDVIAALRNWGATPILWSERETVREALVA